MVDDTTPTPMSGSRLGDGAAGIRANSFLEILNPDYSLGPFR